MIPCAGRGMTDPETKTHKDQDKPATSESLIRDKDVQGKKDERPNLE